MAMNIFKGKTKESEIQKRTRMIVSGDDKEAFGYVKEFYTQWLNYTKAKRQIWRWCDAFAKGLQWGVFDQNGNKLVLPKIPRGRTRITVNRIKTWKLDTKAKMTAQQPTIEVVPKSMSTEDKEGSIVGNKFAQHYQDVVRWDGMYRNIVDGVLDYGDSYVWFEWNKTAGPKYIRQELQRVVDTDGIERMLPTGRLEMVQEGEIVAQVLSPFSVVDNAMPGEIDDKFYVSIVTWEALDFIYNKYGETIDPEKTAEPLDDHSEMMRALISGTGSYYPDRTKFSEGSTLYKVYLRPQEGLEKGFFRVFSAGKTLESGVWPQEFAKMEGYPGVQFSWDRKIDQRFSQSPIEDQIPLQKEYNKTRSQMIEAKDRMMNIKWMVPRGSGVKSITDLSGDYIRYNSGFLPTQSDPKSIPPYVFRHLEFLNSDIEDGQFRHGASKAVLPPGVKSGVGLSKLQEMDDRPISIPERNLEEASGRLFTKFLQVAAVMVSTPRAISYVGRHNERAVDSFVGADMRDHTRVNIRIISGLSKSPAATAEFMMELFRIGVYRKNNGQLDTEKFLEQIQFALPGAPYDESNQHRAVARIENDIFWKILERPQAGIVAPSPQVWQKHEIHLAEHEFMFNTIEWIKSVEQERRENGGNSGPFELACLQHRQITIELMKYSLVEGLPTPPASPDGNSPGAENNPQS